jgi:hypothetical protein
VTDDAAKHLAESGSLDEREADGFYTARCICGWSDGPFPDFETMVDALMDHAFYAGKGSR